MWDSLYLSRHWWKFYFSLSGPRVKILPSGLSPFGKASVGISVQFRRRQDQEVGNPLSENVWRIEIDMNWSIIDIIVMDRIRLDTSDSRSSRRIRLCCDSYIRGHFTIKFQVGVFTKSSFRHLIFELVSMVSC